MSATQSPPSPPADGAIELTELIDAALTAEGLDEVAASVLPRVAEIAGARSSFLYVADPRTETSHFFQHGLRPEVAADVQELCVEQFDTISSGPGVRPVAISASTKQKAPYDLLLFPVRSKRTCVGVIGAAATDDVTSAALIERLLPLLGSAVGRVADMVRSETELTRLNTYLTVSSMLAQSLDLPELLELTFQSSMQAVSAEAASLLLLDEGQENFTFYEVEGPAKPVLTSATFPVDRGIAGAVLQTQLAEIIDDVHSDPRHYADIDLKSGFQTRNMIALPLTAGEERVGVLEVLNKANGARFTQEELHLLCSVAEEIAFAIRNAKIFEYVANSYCKQRQGLNTCKGCKRPLGSWTPCVKYREASM